VSPSLETAIRPFGETGTVTVWGETARVTVTYDELARLGAAAAAALRDKGGARPGSSVAVALQNDLGSVSALLGAWMAGCTVVSLPPAPRGVGATPYAEAFTRVLDRLDCGLVVGGTKVRSLLGAGRSTLPADIPLKTGSVGSDEALPRRALVQFTSGSTGPPKGVVVTGESLAGHVSAICERLEVRHGAESVVSWLPLFHDMGLVGFFLSGLFARSDLLLARPDDFIRNPRSWLDACSERGCTISGAPNFAFRLAARALGHATRRRDLSKLRWCLCGSERVDWDTLSVFHAATKDHAMAWSALTPVYGLAEATLAVSIPPAGDGPQKDSAGRVLLGTPVPGMEVRGESGVLHLRGPWLLDAYVSADGYVDPKTPDGWFETSDAGAVDSEGRIVVAGRTDNVIVVRGRNIHAEDVEEVALRAASGVVGRVAAFSAPDRDDTFCVAVEVVDRAATPEAIAGKIRLELTRSLGITVGDVFVGRALALPSTTSGKPIRSRCRDLVADGEWPNRRVVAVRGRRPVAR